MGKKISTFFAFTILAIMPFMGTANATVCSISNLTLSTACQTGSINNDKKSTLQVNIDSMFSFTDWVFAEKYDGSLETDIDLSFMITGNGLAGNWSFASSAWSSYADIMIVQKGPNAYNYIGYHIADNNSNGAYTTPFGQQDISHWTLYVRGQNGGGGGGTGDPVAEPATLGLLGLGLLGIGLIRRRRK